MKIHFTAAPQPIARQALENLTRRYGQSPLAKADLVVCIGGDGWILNTLRQRMQDQLPVYGMHKGSVGFLMNEYNEHDLLERIDNTVRATIYPLLMKTQCLNGKTITHRAINEVSLWRRTPQIAKIRILVDGSEQMPQLLADGVLLATPAGSTAYNLSVHGPILPLTANLLAMTPISPYRPRRWRGALLPRNAAVRFEVLSPEWRKVSASADASEVRNVSSIDIHEDRSCPLRLLFNEDRALEDRILREQFAD